MVNDMSIIFGIVLLFIVIGVIAPFMNQEFDSDLPINSPSGITGNIKEDDATSTGALKIIASVFKMFFWTFGSIPLWFELIFFVPLRILLVLIIARNIWIGGGG